MSHIKDSAQQTTKTPEYILKILIVIITLATLIRISAALYLGNGINELPGVSDQITYHTLGDRLAKGYGFTFDRPWWPATPAGEQTAHWSYLYSYFVAGVYSLVGAQPLMVRLLQVVLVGVLQTFLLYKLGRMTFGIPAGILAASLGSVYIYFVYYSATLMTEPLYITSILAVFVLTFLITGTTYQPRLTGRRATLAAMGLAIVIGTTILLRQVFLLILPFLFLWILVANRKTHFMQTFLRLALVVIILASIILPFTFFNYQRFGQFVLLNTNAGFALYWANHPVYGTHFQGILSPNQPTYLELLPTELKGYNEAQLDSALLQRGVQFILDDPGRYFLLSLSRIPVYFMFWPSPDSSFLSNVSRVGSFGLLLPFMLYGLIRSFSKSKNSKFPIDTPHFFLFFFIFIYSAIHILTWTLIRYRLPVDAVLLIFAGLGISDLAQRFLPKEWMNRLNRVMR
jgi:4-amino-4-deoxy-L-arabinose transferase-like glycosyltransferase